MQWEERKFEETLTQLEDDTKKQISSQCGFYPDPSLSTNINARHILGDTPIDSYFSRVQNLACHDLTLNQKVPKAATEVLGLGLKFIPTPSSLTTKSKAQASAREVTRNVLLKAFFAGQEEDDEDIPKLQVKTMWWPPPSARKCWTAPTSSREKL